MSAITVQAYSHSAIRQNMVVNGGMVLYLL